jgi:hypothetical protein
VQVSQQGPRAGSERGKPDGKVAEVRMKLREEDSRRASECARVEGLSRSDYLAVLVGEAMREVEKRGGTSANRGGLWSPGQARHLAGMREALVGSTAQIAALGRNVNQIARSLNGNPGVASKQPGNTSGRCRQSGQARRPGRSCVVSAAAGGRSSASDWRGER